MTDVKNIINDKLSGGVMDNIFQLFEMSEVISYHLDLLKNEFVFEVNNYLSGVQKAVFKNVSTFYFIHDDSQNRKNIIVPDGSKNLETSDIGILKAPVTIDLKSSNIRWVSDYTGGGNIFIEIWEQLIILEASSVIINGISYELDNC